MRMCIVAVTTLKLKRKRREERGEEGERRGDRRKREGETRLVMKLEQPQYWLCSESTHPPTWL